MCRAGQTIAMSVLKATNLVKQYNNRRVVDGVSLHVNSGEIVGLLGPNGAGKTTSFYMIVGLVSCDSGEISLDDKAVMHYPIHARAKLGLGYLPQEASVFRKLTVEQNIMAILETMPELSQRERLARQEELLASFHITHIRKSLGMSLSGGERRRVEIARALTTRPRYLLLDEPFAGVDPISVLDIQGIIRQLKDQGIGVLITDHNVRETLGICERAYIVSEGKVIANGSPQDVLQDEKVRQVYLGENFHL